MRILHVINSIGVREGAELSLIDILTGTAAEFEHNVAVLTAEDADIGALRDAGIRVLRPTTPLRSRLGHVTFVREAVSFARPDLIHSSLFDADQAARVIGLLTGTPVLSSVVNMPYSRAAFRAETVPGWKLSLVRHIDGMTSRHLTGGFHAITQAAASHAVEHLRIDRSSTRVVPRGRSRDRLGQRTSERREAVRRRMDWDGRQIVLNVARQEPQKGQIHLIEALPSLLAEMPNALLVIVGRAGRSTAELQRRTDALSLTASVSFLDVRTDVPDLLVGADAFAFPSLFEGLGGALIEAMALGLPVVAFDTPAVNEVLEDGTCGRLIPPGDSAQLSRALLDLLSASDELATTSTARRRFDEVYELGACLQQMGTLYRDIERQLPLRRRSTFVL